MVGKGRDANREVVWRDVVRRRAQSGLTIVEFCEVEGLKPTAFHYWQREIKRRDGQSPRPRRSKQARQPEKVSDVPGLAAVQLVEDRPAAVAGGIVEIVAGNGFVIRVGEQATTEHVRRVLQAVSDLS